MLCPFCAGLQASPSAENSRAESDSVVQVLSLLPQATMAAAALSALHQGSVTFEDVAMFFSWEEWCLLDEAQIQLHLDVMLENFALVCMLGFWCGTQDGETPSEQSESAEGVSQISTPRAGSSPENVQPCKICTPVLRDISHLTEEQRNINNSGQKAYICGACGKQFFFTANIQQHQIQHIGQKSFQFGMGSPTFLKSCMIHARENLSPNMEIANNFVANTELQQQDTSTREKQNNSKECEAVFHSGKSHQSWKEGKIASSHTDILAEDEGVLASKGFCEFSKQRKASTQKINLIQHQKVHTEERPYECSQCGKFFSHRFRFLAHQRVRCVARLYDCSECGKSFSQRENLTAHRKIHSGENSYECKQCNKSFTQKFNLIEHQRVHTGEKPYQCSQCGKCFAHKSSCLAHQRVHTRERPYECSECQKSLTNRSSLSYHLRLHTGEKPYESNECGKCFTTRSMLCNHQSTQWRKTF
ncbi:unnamed protein product [Rangifer tarandus platyrhynchus]|uniref:Uncharacterized protein n=1 Tax=Rangifer tarandus platyrhynchus TaxID=3082113 RepID=A0AC59ZY49_RANTA